MLVKDKLVRVVQEHECVDHVKHSYKDSQGHECVLVNDKCQVCISFEGRDESEDDGHRTKEQHAP